MRNPAQDRYDILVIGAGIAGAGCAAAIASSARTILVEAENQPGMHATGRSAAFWLESYGGPAVAPLTRASHAPLATLGLLRPRGALHLDSTGEPGAFAGIEAESLELLDRSAIAAIVPGIRPEWRSGLLEDSCADIDVAGLHGHFLGRFRRAGGVVKTAARVIRLDPAGDCWTADLENGERIEAAVVVNAAGAWADTVAKLASVAPLGIAPKRRTMVQLRTGRTGLRDLLLVIDAAGSVYFKGAGDRTVWLSPHDEIDSPPCDAAPEEIDVATAIARFESLVDWPIEAVERRWAGLRSFAPDRVPVYGFDPTAPGFFWCAGQGGFGIQTAPAAATLCAALLKGERPAIDPAPYAPGRFR